VIQVYIYNLCILLLVYYAKQFQLTWSIDLIDSLQLANFCFLEKNMALVLYCGVINYSQHTISWFLWIGVSRTTKQVGPGFRPHIRLQQVSAWTVPSKGLSGAGTSSLRKLAHMAVRRKPWLFTGCWLEASVSCHMDLSLAELVSHWASISTEKEGSCGYIWGLSLMLHMITCALLIRSKSPSSISCRKESHRGNAFFNFILLFLYLLTCVYII
jgi:hypothetical protein